MPLITSNCEHTLVIKFRNIKNFLQICSSITNKKIRSDFLVCEFYKKRFKNLKIIDRLITAKDR